MIGGFKRLLRSDWFIPLVMTAAVMAAVVFLVSAIASAAVPHRVTVNRACYAGQGWYRVTFDLSEGGQFIQDDGMAQLEVRAVNGRYGPNGKWLSFRIGDGYLASGGEGNLRFNGRKLSEHGVTWVELRVRHAGRLSDRFVANRTCIN